MKTIREKFTIENFVRRKIKSNTNKNQELFDIDQLFQDVCNIYNKSIQLRALSKMRDLGNNEDFCDKFIRHGLLKRVTRCFQATEVENQHMAAQVLANIALNTKHVSKVKETSEYALINVLRSLNIEVRQHSLRALINIASDLVLEWPSELLKNLDAIMRDDVNTIVTLGMISQLICNMCSEKIPKSILQQMEPIIKYLMNYTDIFMLPCLTTIIYVLSKMGSEHLDFLIETGFVSRLAVLLSNDHYGEQHIALKAIGNFAASPEEYHKEALLNENILSCFPSLLLNENNNICEDTTFVISNIAKGNVNQKQAVIDEGLLPLVIENLNKGNKKLKLKSVSLITDLFDNSTRQQKEFILSCNPLIGLCNLLEYDYINPIEDVLICLRNILKYFERTERITLKIEEYGGVNYLRKLAEKNLTDKVQLYSESILKDFFLNTEASIS